MMNDDRFALILFCEQSEGSGFTLFLPKFQSDWPVNLCKSFSFLFFDPIMRRIASKLAASKITKKREVYMIVE
jgi:hypothetical protein